MFGLLTAAVSPEVALGTTDVANRLGEQSAGETAYGIFRVASGLLGLAMIFFLIAFWLMAMIQVFTRDDLKKSRGLWALIIIFVPFIGQIIYFFSENQKKLGWIYVSTLVFYAFVLIIWRIWGSFM